MPRALRRALAVALLAAAGCGEDDEPASASRPAAQAAPVVVLEIRLAADRRATPRRSTLRCGGTARGTGRLAAPVVARRACRTARREADVLAGARTDEVCTELYGGPQTARVTGRVGARRVARTFDRTDGCRIAEWDALRPLLPRTRGASGP